MGDITGHVEPRHFSNITARQLVVYVRRQLGQTGVRRLLELAGESRTPEQLEDIGGWSSYEQGGRLLEAAEAMLGPGGIRRAASHIDPFDNLDIGSLFQSLGSPAGILRFVAESSAKFSPIVSMRADEITESFGVVSAGATEGFPRFPRLCEFTAGALAQGAQVFGLPPSDVREEECQTRGDPRCRFRVTWTPPTPADTIRRLEKEIDALEGRFDSLKESVAELVAGNDVESVLSCITSRAGLAARALRYLLAVRTEDGGELRVVQEGFDDNDELASATAYVMAADPAIRNGSVLVTEVASGRRDYGRLAAFNTPGVAFLPEERPLLVAYAGLAAVALDSATDLEESRRQTATARALLGLAASLTNLTAPTEMAQRIAAVIPQLVGCTHSGVMLWDAERNVLRMAALHGFEHETGLENLEVRHHDTPHLGYLLTDWAPLYIDDTIDDALLKGFLAIAGLDTLVVVPSVAGGMLRGVVIAGWPARRVADSDLLERLTGVADQAATALQNAHLIDRIRLQALHDPLTELANQRLLEEHTERAISRAKRTGEDVALLFVDLDRFKNVNDTLGHAAGDNLLRQIADRLRAQVRDGDVVARLAGDEFGILIASMASGPIATDLAERINVGLREPFKLGDHEVFISSSIGIARFPGDGKDYADLLRSADVAMYQAKASGRATHRNYTPSMPTQSLGRLSLEGDLHGAVARGELRVLYQPLVELGNRHIVGAEALVRWQHPRLGLLSPDTFIGLAEECGLIVEIDGWVLGEACRQAGAWLAEGLPSVRMAVNVASNDLRQDGLADRVADVLATTGLEGSQLELEISERVAETTGDTLSDVLAGLGALGVRLAIDDFGTGNSTFGRLTHRHLHTVKIDQSFLESVVDETSNAPLVVALLGLGQSLGLTVVAEGVETEGQVAFLRQHGCELAQGYLFARPLTADAFAQLLGHSNPIAASW